MTEISQANTPISTENVTQVAPETLNIGDIQNAIRIIDFSCDQGAFKGWDQINQVQTVRNRLAAFVISVTPPEENQDENVERVELTSEAPR